MPPEVAEASARRLERVSDEESDQALNTLLAHYQTVTANPRSMGYLRFLLKHYAKSAHPWHDCYKDNFKRFGPKTAALCVVPDTPVSTEHGLVSIADLKVGDLVWSYDGTEFVLKPVLWSGLTRRKASVCRLEIEEDVEVLATPDHPFMRYRGEWADAGDLRVGEFLLGPLLGRVGDGVLTTTSDAVSVARSDTLFADTGVLGPRMALRASGIILSDPLFRLDDLVGLNDLSDLLMATWRHQGIYDTHHGYREVTVHSPVESNAARDASVIGRLDRADPSTPEDMQQLLKRLDVVLGSNHRSAPAAELTGVFSGCSVPTKASFAFQEASCVPDVLGREITKVSVTEKRLDVWDIEVADTHNFVIHNFIIAHNCGVLKDTIRQRTDWRGKGPRPNDVGSPGVAIGEADAPAAPPFGGHRNLKLSIPEVPDEIWALLEDVTRDCNPCRVLLGLEDPPHPSTDFLALSEAA